MRVLHSALKNQENQQNYVEQHPYFFLPRSFILTVKISHSNPTTIQNLAVVLGGSPLNAPLSKLKWEPLPSLIGPFL